ncbi:MAG: hypothetical protein IH968_09545 [Gemmatimonadetes bacterium]|nr:hypothetical protein [Gemmatimonadota bacterium]
MNVRIRKLALVGLVLALAGGDALSAQEQPAPAVVEIGLVDGEITVSPDTVVVAQGQEVDWRFSSSTEIVRFNIRFDSGVPFGQNASENGFNGNADQAAQGTVQPEAVVGQLYKYTIRVIVGGGQPIVLDPEVEIGPPT